MALHPKYAHRFTFWRWLSCWLVHGGHAPVHLRGSNFMVECWRCGTSWLSTKAVYDRIER